MIDENDILILDVQDITHENVKEIIKIFRKYKIRWHWVNEWIK